MRVKFRSDKGAITVFLSIIIVALILMVGVIVDFARIKVAKTYAKRAVEQSSRALLAGYSKELKEGYGLFANSKNAEGLTQELQVYLENNLITDLKSVNKNEESETIEFLKRLLGGQGGYKDKSFLDLYGFKIENVKVEPIYNLTENKVTRNQIIEYMKYRAPINIIFQEDDFLKKIETVSKMGEDSKLLKLKAKIDRLSSQIDADLGELNKTIQNLRTLKPEKYKYSSARSKIRGYIDLALQYKTALRERKELISKISKAKSDSKKSNDYLKGLQDDLSDLNKQISNTRQSIKDEFNNLMGELEKYRNFNIDAIEKLKKIESELIEARAKIEELKKQTEKLQDNDKLKDSMLKDLEELSKEYPTQERISSIKLKLQKNADILNEIISGGSSFRSFHNNTILSDSWNDKERVKPGVESSLSGIKNYTNDSSIDIGISAKQIEGNQGTLKKIRDIVKNVKTNLNGSNNKSLKEIKLEVLPSYYNTKNNSFPNKVNTEGSINLGSIAGENDFSAESLQKAKSDDYEGKNNKDESFSEQGFQVMESLTAKLNDMIKTKVDELYVNEYILDRFQSLVTKQEYNNTQKMNVNAKIDNKQVKEKALDYEIEYILFGMSKDSENALKSRIRLVLVRFPPNFLYAYTNKEIRTATLEAATVIGGALTGGAGIPFIQAGLISALAMNESILDTNDLIKGDKVPFFKSEYSWKTGFIKAAAKGTVDDKGLAFTYQDYLRIFLLMQSPEVKMNRIEDLIQCGLNDSSSKSTNKLSRYSTYLKIEVDVSIKYLFITQAFVPKSLKTNTGDRHKIKIILYQGY